MSGKPPADEKPSLFGTGNMEGYYRTVITSPGTRPGTSQKKHRRTPSAQSTEVALDFGITAAAVVSGGDAGMESMWDPEETPPVSSAMGSSSASTPRAGVSFRDPGELGVAVAEALGDKPVERPTSSSPTPPSFIKSAVRPVNVSANLNVNTNSNGGKRRVSKRESSGEGTMARPPSGDKRSSTLRRMTMTPAAAAAAAAEASGIIGTMGSSAKKKGRNKKRTLPSALVAHPSMVCALAYRGMEVVFATNALDMNRPVLGICSRTRAPFQTLDIPHDAGFAVAICCHADTGMVLVATSNGFVHSFVPVMTVPAKSNNDSNHEDDTARFPLNHQQNGNDRGSSSSSAHHEIVTAFGRFRWVTGRVVRCREVFQPPDKPDGTMFEIKSREEIIASTTTATKTKSKIDTSFVDISCSSDHKILVAHRDQLAIFDATPEYILGGEVDDEQFQQPYNPKQPVAELLWTTRAPASIVTAKLSGDGMSIALVAKGEGVGVPFPYGARTYIRDRDDGSSSSIHDEGIPPVSSISGTSSSTIPKRNVVSKTSNTGLVPMEILPSERPKKLGQRETSTASSSSSRGVGILYKPGPFLVHSASVTRISFRGLGHNNSEVHIAEEGLKEADEGNDLLLTHCEQDGTMRIFSQNSWKQLMQWNAPSGSRADWIHGISAFNLGDLDPRDRNDKGGTSSSAASSRVTSQTDLAGMNTSTHSGGINQALTGAKPFSALPAHPTPTSSAGAWIAEITFRNAFPALRLSRLSYMKAGGDEAHPAHFESVAAMLPPGSLTSGSTLEEMGLCLQGIWSAWNPWASTQSNIGAASSSTTLSGSAMEMLGLPHGGQGTGALGAHALGGTHSPPSELRLVASHPLSGRVILMEFPLWGDSDFGAMEFGSPLRYLLAMSDDDGLEDGTRVNISNEKKAPTVVAATSLEGSLLSDKKPPLFVPPPPVCMDYESHCLCAHVGPSPYSISLTWRKQGTMSILPVDRNVPFHSSFLASTETFDSADESVHSFGTHDDTYTDGPELFEDVSMVPLPLQLPPLHLPSNIINRAKRKGSSVSIVSLHWWPDENFGGPPRIFAVTSDGSLVLYEMPPPWSALEPPMPTYDPLSLTSAHSICTDGEGVNASDSDSNSEEGTQKEYEVLITPHPDFGLGLRLEAQADGMPAIAGSFKKHPLSGGKLPAERTGMIVLGDELISANGVSLEGLTFDEIIGRVREIGAKSQNAALGMTFRSVSSSKRRTNFFGSILTSSSGQGGSLTSGETNPRRTKEQMLGIKPKRSLRSLTSSNDDSDVMKLTSSMETEEHDDYNDDSDHSHVSLLIGADNEAQQEFGRIVGTVQHSLPSEIDKDLTAADKQSLAILLPWTSGRGAPASLSSYGAALFVSASGKTITASRLEITDDNHPENIKFDNLGTLDLGAVEGESIKCSHIRSLSVVKSVGDSWCLAVCDKDGNVILVFIDVVEDEQLKSPNSSKRPTDELVDDSPSSPFLLANFRQIHIFQSFEISQSINGCLLRAASIDLIATMPRQANVCRSVTVWSALPLAYQPTEPTHKEKCEEDTRVLDDYVQTTISLPSSALDEEQESENSIVDFRFVQSGSMDAFPWLVLFTKKSAIVYRRPGSSLNWTRVAELQYGVLEGSRFFAHPDAVTISRQKDGNRFVSHLSPADMQPHLIPALKSIVAASDERNYIRSDWHPDSILAYVCTEERGVEVALDRSVRGIYNWLSRWMSPDESTTPLWDVKFPLGIAPLPVVQDDAAVSVRKKKKMKNKDSENSASFFSNLTVSQTVTQAVPTEKDLLLFELQAALCPGGDKPNTGKKSNVSQPKRSKEFLIAMSHGIRDEEKSLLPGPLSKLNRDELRFLWAVGEVLKDPPDFNGLDPHAQLCIFCVSLLRAMEKAKDDEDHEETRLHIGASSPRGLSNEPKRNFFKRNSSVETQTPQEPSAIATAGCLAALLSDSQNCLLSACRVEGKKLDWPTVREARLPFWLRSNSELRTVAEEVGQGIYKKTKDVMECSLFYVAMRNMRTLKNLAATDRSESGKTFLKFILNHDFSSLKGRKAAEKNAYSLLRKRRYGVAASFFLLAEPPMLNTALEIIVSQMGDLNLAFLVARLVESTPSTGPTLGSGMGSSFGGMLGGSIGGGMMSLMSGVGQPSPAPKEEEKYCDWKPDLDEGAKNLLKNRGLLIAESDPCLQAVQYLWLGVGEEAASCLSTYSSNREDSSPSYSDLMAPTSFDKPPARTNHTVTDDNLQIGLVRSYSSSTMKTTYESANCRVLAKANDVINFTSCPFLLKKMKVDKRHRWSSTLSVSRALCRRGMEFPSMRILLQNTDPSELDETAEEVDEGISSNVGESNGEARTGAMQLTSASGAVSSIFDSYDTPKPNTGGSAQTNPMNGNMASSIFDSFDAPPPKVRPKRTITPPPSETAMSSSIFDSFDTAPPRPKPVKISPPSSGAMTSSIFDSFDAPVVKKKTSSNSEMMSSSIFDSFDVAPPKSKQVVAPNSGDMQSSIFDSFDPPPSKKTISTSVSEDVESMHDDKVNQKDEREHLSPLPIPYLWGEWRQDLLGVVAARRLIREMARIIARFHGDSLVSPMKIFRRQTNPLVPHKASVVLKSHCLGDSLLNSLRRCLKLLCSTSKLTEEMIVEQALLLLGCRSQPRRIVFIVLLHCLIDRADLAEDTVRDAAAMQMYRCEAFVLANDELVYRRKTVNYEASMYIKRHAALVSWQLELCLWLHRGETFAMSGVALKETVVAVRVGMLLAGWGRSHECLETILKCEPDCAMNNELGRQLWSSMKMISSIEDTVKKSGNGGSGGWEFLVDCRRDEAAKMLRDRKPGTFLLRPHAEDHGVFTLSFKTNLVPSTKKSAKTGDAKAESKTDDGDSTDRKNAKARPVKKDEVVQHAILRLSDSGFRCGSFGPFTTLIKLLEAVSESLPFDLIFNEPPVQGIIKEQGAKPSPNSFFLRKFALHASSNDFYQLNKKKIRPEGTTRDKNHTCNAHENGAERMDTEKEDEEKERTKVELEKRFGMFSQLLAMSEIRKQLCSVAAAEYEDLPLAESNWQSAESFSPRGTSVVVDQALDDSVDEDLDSEMSEELGIEEMYAVASRLMRPLLSWCRAQEIAIVHDLAPSTSQIARGAASLPVAVAVSDTAIEAAGSCVDGGDAVIRRMIQPGSGVGFRTLRVGEGNDSAIVVLFSKRQAISWFISSGSEKDKTDAASRLELMQTRRVIEPIDMKQLVIGKSGVFAGGVDLNGEDIRYRFVDPWEVEALESKEGEFMGAVLGREAYTTFSVNTVAKACETAIRKLGGLHLLGLWTLSKGGICLTKALASVHPPWELDAGSDLQMRGGKATQPSPYINSIRQHLYRNALFRRLDLPQRFLALVQVELLDLKNLTAPGGSSSLTAYAMLRLKRQGSGAPLTLKARTLDSASTQPRKIGKSSGPNAPASWGSLVRFRFPLPEDVHCDGLSFDRDREALFKGPPCELQVSVYEKKFMSDIFLGGADVKLDALASGGQLEEWVPLRAAGSDGITWFARIRLTLRFELMCLADKKMTTEEMEICPSVGLRKIRQLSRLGGAHEDTKGIKQSASTPDLLGYFESMVH